MANAVGQGRVGSLGWRRRWGGTDVLGWICNFKHNSGLLLFSHSPISLNEACISLGTIQCSVRNLDRQWLKNGVLSTEPLALVFLYQPRRLRVRKVRGNSPETLARQDRRREDGMDHGWPGDVRSLTHAHIVRKPSNDCCGEPTDGTRAYSYSLAAWFPPK